MNRITDQRGQAMFLTVLFMSAMLGMAALVLDVGSWFRSKRDLQAIADAAALAGAQALPENPGQANALAREYITKNKGDTAGVTIAFTSKLSPSDTIHVKLERPAPGIFSQVLGVSAVDIGAKAAARSANPNAARWAAPIGVDEKHPLLGCKPLPCFQVDTTLDMDKVGPGAFRILNLDRSKGGTGQQILAEWIRQGYDGYMPLGQYKSDPGAKFNTSEVRAALDFKIGDELLFPVYRTIREEGANLEYEVVGWVGFVITGYEARGNSGKLFGRFTRVIWEGFQSESLGGNPDFGVRSIELVE